MIAYVDQLKFTTNTAIANICCIESIFFVFDHQGVDDGAPELSKSSRPKRDILEASLMEQRVSTYRGLFYAEALTEANEILDPFVR